MPGQACCKVYLRALYEFSVDHHVHMPLCLLADRFHHRRMPVPQRRNGHAANHIHDAALVRKVQVGPFGPVYGESKRRVACPRHEFFESFLK